MSRLVGRDDALARLHAAAARAEADEPRILLVEGEAGIGKCRLVAELLSVAEPHGALVLFGTCPPIAGPDLPLAPVVQALRGLARTTSPEDAATVFGPARSVLSVLVPSLAAPGEAQHVGGVPLGLLFEHILGVLERLSLRNKLVILVLDDIHWGGPSTWDLLAHLARNLASVRVLVLATYRRDALDDRSSQLLVELRRSPLVETIELGGLDPDAVGELVSELRPDLSVAGRDAVLARAHGNPFYVEELIAGAGDGAVPETLRATLLLRIQGQPEEVLRVLRVLAVIGRRADAELLIRVLGYTDELAIAALRRAVRAGLLEAQSLGSSEGYVFSHELLREVVYAELLPGERSRLHGAVARALSAQPDPGGSTTDGIIELATHWRESGDMIRAVPALLKAADAAQGAYAFVEAHRLYEQAFASMDGAGPGGAVPAPESPSIGFRPAAAHDTGPEWVEIHARAAEAASLAGEPAQAIEHIDAALAQAETDPTKALRWTERRARYLLEAGRETESLETYRALTDRADGIPPTERPRVLVAHARALTLAGHFREAGEVAETALGLARDARQASEEWQALNLVGTSHAFAGRSKEGLEALAEARRLSQDRASPSVIHPRPSRIGEMLGGQLSAARALDQAGRSGEALDLALEGAATADRLGAAGWRGELDLAAAWQLLRHGRWAEARARCEEVLNGATGKPLAEAHLLRGWTGVVEGRWEDAELDLAAAELLVASTTRSDVIASYHLAVAELAYWRRRHSQAAGTIADGLARLGETEDRLSRAELCLFGLRLDVELHADAQMHRAGTELATRGESAARSLGEIRALLASEPTAAAPERLESSRGSAVLAAAEAEYSRLAGPDPTAWTNAVDAASGADEPYAATYARWRLAESLLGARDSRGQARTELREALEDATRLGAQPLAGEIESLATRARLDLEVASADLPASTPAPGSELGLSDRELEVLALVADGRTNRQIAEALFITEKTAGHHVSNILAKLDVANRLEAASIAHRAGLTNPRPLTG